MIGAGTFYLVRYKADLFGAGTLYLCSNRNRGAYFVQKGPWFKLLIRYLVYFVMKLIAMVRFYVLY